MYKIDLVCFGKDYGTIVETRLSAFNVYYMLIGIVAEHSKDWLIQLSDLDTGKILVEFDSELMEGIL